MRTALLTLTLALSLAATAQAQQGELREIRLHLRDIGARQIAWIRCDHDICRARYAYVYRAPRWIGNIRPFVHRCYGEFRVSAGIDDLGRGDSFEWVEVDQYLERCRSSAWRFVRR